MTRNRILAIGFCIALCALLQGCAREVARGGAGIIYPDYTFVTVPADIAPLNFVYNTPSKGLTTTFTAGATVCTVKGWKVVWNEKKWHELIKAATDGVIRVSNSRGDEWEIYVSPDPMDSYLTYRLIEPGYEVWHEVEIRERCVKNFDETVLCDFRHTDNACMNCHIHGQQRGDLSMFYVRGPKGGAMLNRSGRLSRLNLRSAERAASTVYGELHPDGHYGVFSTNVIIPAFHSQGSRRLEVYDSVSDLTVADLDRDSLLFFDEFARADKFETFPVFSADGRSVIYCSADTLTLPKEIGNLRYSLLRTSFDPETGALGPGTDTLWSAGRNAGSACHPKCSPDGRWVMFTIADYGTFPIWHQECDLALLDLSSGEVRMLDSANAWRSDSYHSWSSNGRWFVFASKRDDGQYGKPYFCHIDEEGRTAKPFVLPQKDPDFYDRNLKSFNIPDFAASSVGFTAEQIGAILK